MTWVRRQAALTIIVGFLVIVLGATGLATAIGRPAGSKASSAPNGGATSPDSSESQTPAPAASGPCVFAVRGGAEFVQLMKGIDQHTVTRTDVSADLVRIAGHLNDATTIATGTLRHAAADGSLRARQIREMFSTPGPQPKLSVTSRELANDFNRIHRICLP
jgi:hypothetical protein